jgi:hypothetical protein
MIKMSLLYAQHDRNDIIFGSPLIEDGSCLFLVIAIYITFRTEEERTIFHIFTFIMHILLLVMSSISTWKGQL